MGKICVYLLSIELENHTRSGLLLLLRLSFFLGFEAVWVLLCLSACFTFSSDFRADIHAKPMTSAESSCSRVSILDTVLPKVLGRVSFP